VSRRPKGPRARSAAGSPDLSVEVGPLRLRNPVIAASGTFGYGTEFDAYFDLEEIGGFVTKGLSLRPRKGNAPPRTCETACGMLNAIGLANVGVEAFLEEKLPAIAGRDTVVIANVFGETEQEYVEVARRLNAARGVHALELNLSCPNTERGGIAFGVSPALTREVVAAVRRAAPDQPLIVKLTPNITDIAEAARAARDGGADILSLVNTFLGIAIDLERRRPILDNVVGGLSGPAIKPLALYMVHRVFREVRLPIIGMGGIATANDVLEFLIAGATAVQVGTANFTDPLAPVKVARGLASWCGARRIGAVREIVGTLAVPERPPVDGSAG
jgi:dihydroorotate dehydrogenase (NAD+) catalytic subunit